MARDPHKVREDMRVFVMVLAHEIGADLVPKELLDEMVAICMAKGRRAAKAHFRKKRRELLRPPTTEEE